MTRAFRDAAIYGSLAFGLGFLFGVLREAALKPGLGDRAGEAAEFVIVTAMVVLLGLWLSRGWPSARTARLLRGIGGVCALLAMESALALGFLGQPLDAYLASFDVTSGAMFPWGLLAMAVAPALRRR